MRIYEASGELMRGFLGTITYETALPEDITSLEISISFGKREREQATQEDKEECGRAWKQSMGTEADEEQIEKLIAAQKAEIVAAVFHNQVQLGCAHRDETEKHIVISPEQASRGFRKWKPSGGLLSVELEVFEVLNDHTPYHIVVKGV